MPPVIPAALTRLPIVVSAATVLFGSLSLPCAAQKDKEEAPRKPDAGKFLLTMQGMKAGTCTFKFDADGGSEAEASVELQGQTQTFKVTVKAKGGKVTGIGADAGPANHFSARIAGDKAEISINDAAPQSQTIPAGALPFGNASPHLLNYLLGAYDAKKGGAQPFTMLLAEGLPGGQFISFPGKLSAKGTHNVSIGGKPVAVTTHSFVIEAGGTKIEMTLYADADRRMLAWQVPSQNYTAVREGFDAVLKTPGS